MAAQVRDSDGEDWAAGDRCVAESLQVRLAERPFPREAAIADEPRLVAVAHAGGDVR